MTTYTLRYDGQDFTLSVADHRALRKIYTSGLAISGQLFDFTPVGAEGVVTIAVGSGAVLTITATLE